ncbi:MAG: hypothetical protein EP343_27135 [Deltaproteobacteria bacterium]|nr:MAG: hypothetical protein EP343_27135 [Deltaproteobacteria bacterium]
MNSQNGIRGLLVVMAALFVFVTHCGQPRGTDAEPQAQDSSVAAEQDRAIQENKDSSEEASKEQTPSVPSQRFSPQEDLDIQYSLRWSWEGATWDESSQSYVFKNDLGYMFGVKAGYVGIAAMQLVVCEDAREIQPTLGYLWKWLPLRFGVRAAHADHNFTNDSSFAGNLIAERMLDPKVKLFGNAKASGSPYCQLHVLYVPLNQDASDGFKLKRSSIHFQGWYQAPNSLEKMALDAKVHLQGGGLVPLYPSQQPTSPSSSMEVDVIRYPARSFQGIDPTKLVALEVAQKVLLQMSQTTRVEIRLPNE